MVKETALGGNGSLDSSGFSKVGTICCSLNKHQRNFTENTRTIKDIDIKFVDQQ